MSMIRNRSHISSYVTKDGSAIRELFHPSSSPVEGISVAEATVMPGQETAAHRHNASQEIYYVLEGRGSMTLGGDARDVRKGDAILIPPGTVHRIRNAGDKKLRFLCICHPPYSHDDTALER